MGVHGAQERRKTDMTRIAIRRIRPQGDVGQRVVTGHVGKSSNRAGLTRRTAMALETVAYKSISQVIDLIAQESAGIFMAVLARLLRREMICRLAHDSQRLSVVASRALTGYGDMAKAFYQETGGTDMACVTRKSCRNMAAGTVFGSVLENAVDVALFAFQGRMDLSENKPCFRVIEGIFYRNCLRCSRKE
jgi:hypothetical protein